MDIHDIVVKLIGKISPIGETREDDKRMVNLQEHMILTRHIISDLKDVAEDKDRGEYSMSRAGKEAYNFLMNIKDELSELVD